MTRTQLEGCVQPGGRSSFRATRLFGQLNFVPIIQIPILFGSDKIEMGLFETEGQKERLVEVYSPYDPSRWRLPT